MDNTAGSCGQRSQQASPKLCCRFWGTRSTVSSGLDCEAGPLSQMAFQRACRSSLPVICVEMRFEKYPIPRATADPAIVGARQARIWVLGSPWTLPDNRRGSHPCKLLLTMHPTQLGRRDSARARGFVSASGRYAPLHQSERPDGGNHRALGDRHEMIEREAGSSGPK